MSQKNLPQLVAALQRTKPRALIQEMHGSATPTVTFPTTPLRSKCFIARNPDYSQPYTSWDWIDASERVQWDQGMRIEAGKGERDDVPRASTATFKIRNADGELSRNNPLSTNYGLLSRHNPVWIQNDVGDGFKDRYFGWTTDLPKNINRFNSTIVVTCKDALDHLLQTQTVKSPVFRTVLGKNNAYPPYAYYPLEEGGNATQFANAAGAGKPAQFITFAGSEPVPGGDSTMPGGRPVVSIPSITNVTVRLAPYTNTGRHVHLVAMRIPNHASALAGLAIFTKNFQLTGLIDPTALNTSAINRNTGATVFTNSANFSEPIVDKWVSIVISSQDTGGGGDNLTIKVLNQNGIVIASTSNDNGGVYENAIAAVIGNQSPGGVPNVGVGHYQAITNASGYNMTTNPVPYARATGGWDNEQMHLRGARIAAEEGFTWFCQAGTSEELGIQQTLKAVDVLRVGAKADNGYLYAYRFGLAYKALSEFHNQPVSIALDANSGHLPSDLQSVDNTQNFFNRWIVRRNSGSFSIDEVQGGIPSSQGIFEGDDTFNLFSDTQTADLASYLANRDATEPEQWPYIPVSLTANPQLIAIWREMTLGNRFTVDGLSAYSGVPFLDLLLDGYVEVWKSTSWDTYLNGSDGSYLQVGALDADPYRLDSGSTDITADITSGATQFEVFSADIGDIWTLSREHPEDFPVALTIAGEAMSATAIEGAVWDGFDRTESNGWGTANTGQTWAFSGGSASNYSVSSSAGKITLPTGDLGIRRMLIPGYKDFSVLTAINVSATATGADIRALLDFRYAVLDTNYELQLVFLTTGFVDVLIVKRVGGVNTVIVVASNYIAYSAGVPLNVRLHCYGSSIRATVWASVEPLNYTLVVTDTALISPAQVGLGAVITTGNTNVNPVVSFDRFLVNNPAVFTVTRAVNGIVKPHKANMGSISEVHVRYPYRMVS